MQVNTKKVTDRRKVRYESLEELLADAQQLAANGARTVGNWSQGEIYDHLAKALDSSIDGANFSFPAPVRWVALLLFKRRFLKKGLPAGYKAPGQYVPKTIPTEDALKSLEQAIARQQQEAKRARHPIFGNIDREEWTDFHLRHAELHMSFLVDDRNAPQ
jgi:hypothetical protein